ncbi:hypothetical protein F5X99DRAFT_389576 [Biscogniauxia marginata]|nr:hypothetical protein F5X99DRAFT_389576 [Biscogniauxia marginata]
MRMDSIGWGSPSTGDEGLGSKRKRTFEGDEEPSDRPAKVRKVINSTRLGPSPAAPRFRHQDESKMPDELDTDDEKSSEEPSTEATEDSYTSTSTPASSDHSPWWDSDIKVIVYKRDDFTGRIRPRRMMDDMYANSSKEKMEKYKWYYQRYISSRKESTGFWDLKNGHIDPQHLP